MSAHTAERWEDRALCRDANPRLFFPDGAVGLAAAASYRVAKGWCAICPVRPECLEAAMGREGWASTKERHGVWGGLDPSERAALHKRRQRAQAEERAAA